MNYRKIRTRLGGRIIIAATFTENLNKNRPG